MKKRKTTVSLITILALIICVFTVFAGCASNAPVTVTKIEQSADGGFTVTYSDGTTDNIAVGGKDGANGLNGKDGLDGSDVTVDDLYNAYKERVDPDATFAEFLENFTLTTDTTAAVNESLCSSISIYTEFIETTTSFFQQSISSRAMSAGSGVIFRIDSDYVYAITNFHVVYDSKANPEKNGNGSKFAYQIKCYLYGSESYPAYADDNKDGKADTDTYGYIYDYDSEYALDAELIGASASADIAVLRIKTEDVRKVNPDENSVKAAKFADSYRVGQTAIAIGNPESEGISATQGIVSVDNEYISLSVDGTTRKYRSMRIDTAIYHGSSGGGLFDENGRLIGITNSGDEDDQNINYAIPLEIVRGTVENIMTYRKDGEIVNPKKITLGFTVTSSNVRNVFDGSYGTVIEDITVQEVTEGSIANQLGLKSGDILNAITVSGKTYNLNRQFDISDIMLRVKNNDSISISYTRDGNPASTAIYDLSSAPLTVID